jgi:hypothetical protein
MCETVGVEPMHIPIIRGGYQDGASAVLEGSKKNFYHIRNYVDGVIVEDVTTNTIDSFVTAKKLGRVDFIKVDTEGAEERIIHGGFDTINRFLPSLYIETPFDVPWLKALYDIGYDAFYNDGYKLYKPSKGEWQSNTLLIHAP